MKRDMDLIRQILLEMRNYEHGYAPNISIEGYSSDQIGFHCYLMADAGLIEAIEGTSTDDDSPQSMAKSLTWYGYEFIEDAYDDKIWKESKEVVSKLGTASFSVWTAVLTQIVAKNLGI